MRRHDRMDGQVANVTLTVMLTRPAGHEAKAEAEARKSEAEDEAQNFFRGRGHNVWGRGQTR